MGDTPKSIAALRNYYRDRTKPRDPDALLADLQKESDRALVVIMAAVLEDALTLKLAQKMRRFSEGKKGRSDFDRMFSNNGPLSTFSGKIAMAYRLEIIDEQTRDELDDIREMRNACAHSFFPISFNLPELAKVCRRLLGKEDSLVKIDDDAGRADLRLAFQVAALCIFLTIDKGSRDEVWERMQPYIKAAEEKLEKKAEDDA